VIFLAVIAAVLQVTQQLHTHGAVDVQVAVSVDSLQHPAVLHPAEPCGLNLWCQVHSHVLGNTFTEELFNY
jgi:hypothetical protein